MNQEIIAKAREAKSAEELLAVARENDLQLNEDGARELYDRLHATFSNGSHTTRTHNCLNCGHSWTSRM